MYCFYDFAVVQGGNLTEGNNTTFVSEDVLAVAQHEQAADFRQWLKEESKSDKVKKNTNRLDESCNRNEKILPKKGEINRLKEKTARGKISLELEKFFRTKIGHNASL